MNTTLGHVISGRNTQLRRQWQILRLLSVNRFTTIPLICSTFSVHAKTAYRDLEALESAGFPLVWRTEDDSKTLRFVRLEQSFASVFARLREIRQ